MGAILDAGARLPRRPQPPALTNWITAFMGRDRSHDITAARSELRYIPLVRLAESSRSTAVLGVSCALRDPHYASSACATFRSSA